MAFFKFRLPGQNAGEATSNFSNSPAESVEVLRRRARHRLIGATVLVIIGVVGFPLVFDTQPRPVSVDIAVDIPDRIKTKPMVSPSAATKQAPLATDAALSPTEEVVVSAKKEETPTPVPSPTSQPSVATPTTALPAMDKTAEPVASAVSDGPRFVVQIGAFAEEIKVKEVRLKLEKAGFKTYTNIANTKDGPRTRVRVGPFSSKDEAEKIANKIKQLQLQPQVLTL
ncbi:MAG: SPOR domain-containing protein [Burkholderiales bacterium]|jgi:DedD protein|nr:SPOR domain-containing protein [Burkholderiales bacterium]